MASDFGLFPRRSASDSYTSQSSIACDENKKHRKSSKKNKKRHRHDQSESDESDMDSSLSSDYDSSDAEDSNTTTDTDDSSDDDDDDVAIPCKNVPAEIKSSQLRTRTRHEIRRQEGHKNRCNTIMKQYGGLYVERLVNSGRKRHQVSMHGDVTMAAVLDAHPTLRESLVVAVMAAEMINSDLEIPSNDSRLYKDQRLCDLAKQMAEQTVDKNNIAAIVSSSNERRFPNMQIVIHSPSKSAEPTTVKRTRRTRRRGKQKETVADDDNDDF